MDKEVAGWGEKQREMGVGEKVTKIVVLWRGCDKNCHWEGQSVPNGTRGVQTFRWSGFQG
jgi:hypothetical protein